MISLTPQTGEAKQCSKSSIIEPITAKENLAQLCYQQHNK